MKFTDTAIRRLKTKATRYEVFEDGARGFGVRVSPNGRKSWISSYRSRAVRHGRGYGKLVKMTHGEFSSMTLAQARVLHAQVRAALERGEDPAAERRAKRQQKRAKVVTAALEVGDTVQGLFEIYVRRELDGQRTGAERERLLRKEIVTRLGAMPVAQITRPVIAAAVDEVAARAPVAANRTLSALRRMLAFAVERGIIDSNPALGMRKAAQETPRDRVLSNDELRVLWQDLEAEDVFGRTVVRLLLATGSRKAEVVGARWSEFDGNIWTIPSVRVKTSAKSGKDHVVPISSLMRELLDGLPRVEDSLFPGKSNGSAMHKLTPNRIIARVQKSAKMEPFTVHDLRRTCRTNWAEMRIDVDVCEALLGHSLGSTVYRAYDRYSRFPEKAEALEKWGDRLQQIVRAQDARVLSMTRSC